MSILSKYKQDYKLTLEAYKEAAKDKDTVTMERLSSDLIRLADLIEGVK